MTRYRDLVLADAPAGYWTGDWIGPKVRDDSPNGRDMPIAGEPCSDRGPSAAIPKAFLTFTTGAALIETTATNCGVTADYTIEGWFKLRGTIGAATLAYVGNSGSDGMGIYCDGTNICALHGGRALGANAFAPNPNEWMHLMLAYSGGTYDLLRNGVVALSAGIATPNTPSSKVRILEGFVAAAAAHVAVYTRRLDTSVARNRYAAGLR